MLELQVVEVRVVREWDAGKPSIPYHLHIGSGPQLDPAVNMDFLLPDSVFVNRSEKKCADMRTMLDALIQCEGVSIAHTQLEHCTAIGITPRSSRFVLSFLDGRERPIQLKSLDHQSLIPHFDLYRRSLASIARSSEEAPLRGFEALDVGRRVVHDEAAELLQELLAPLLELELEAARRLFTLLYLLRDSSP